MRVDVDNVLKVVWDSGAVVEKLAFDQTGDQHRTADTEQDVLLVGENLYRLVILSENALDFAQGSARNHEFHFPGHPFDGLAAYGKTVAVDRCHIEARAIQLEQAAGMDRLGFVVGNRENRLGNHAFQDILGQRKPGSAGNLSERREFVRLGRGQIKHRAAAFDSCHQLVVRLDIDDVVRQLADNVEQQPCIDNDAARLDHIGLGRGADAHRHVITGDGQRRSISADKQTLEQRHRAFAGNGARSCAEKTKKDLFFAGKLHIDSFL